MLKKYYRQFKRWMDYNPPGALSGTGWKLFRREYKQRAPIRYWIRHTFHYGVIMPIHWKYRRICEWIRYRTYDKYHVVKTGLEPGYYDKSHLMLHVNFNMLKDFVECELVRRNCFDNLSDEKLTLLQRWLPSIYRYSYCNPARGIKYLEWESTLDDPTLPPNEQSPQQAVAAREKLALYKWWTETRPSRVEIEVIHPRLKQDSTDILDFLDDDFDRSTAEYKEYLDAVNKEMEQEKEWNEEDDQMLIRLMKVRQTLWT